MTSTEIQNILWKHYEKTRYLIVPNVGWFFGTGEADLITVARNSHYANEYEIKVSRSDFKADFKKRGKHWRLSDKEIIWTPKNPVANRFYYVCPKDLIKADEVPEYAGLIYIDNDKGFYSGKVKEVKTAPLLHKNKLSEARLLDLARLLQFKYWNHTRSA